MSQNDMPGLGTARTVAFRNIWIDRLGRMIVPGMRIINGSLSRDPLNTGDIDVLQAGMLMGKITSSGKYAPSVIGVTAEAIDATETALTVSQATATELARRIGAAGSVYIVGPPTAGGVVRVGTLTYSGIVTTTVTYTALGISAVWSVTAEGAAAEKIVFEVEADANSKTAGTAFTAPIAWNCNAVVADAALEAIATVGTGMVAATTTATSGQFLLTFSPDMGNPVVRAYGNVPITVSKTMAGVDGRFISGAFLCATDGSHIPLAILDKDDGEKVTDDTGTSIDIQAKHLVMGCPGGMVDTSQIINCPSDTTLLAWLKAQLRAVGTWNLDDDF